VQVATDDRAGKF